MKQWISAVMLCGLMALIGCGVDQPAPEGADGTAAVEQAVKAPTDVVTPNVGRIWQILSWVNCNTEFGQPCTATFPAPQCPASVVNRKPCAAPEGYFCYRTGPSGIVADIYECETW